MNSVEPIRDYNKIIDIADYLKSKSMRDYVLFSFGIYIPIRISDILKLKVRDIKNRDVISIREMKTGKEQRLGIHKNLKKIIQNYIIGMDDHDFLFPSRECDKLGNQKPITRQQAYNILNDAAKNFGLHRIGCHTMRKTFGWHHYQQHKDIMILQMIFNHPDPNTTKRYIGLTQDDKCSAILNFDYKPL